MAIPTDTLLYQLARFRARAESVFYTWAHQWLLSQGRNITREDAMQTAQYIQSVYWGEFKRNPTTAEWAADFRAFYGMPGLCAADIRKRDVPRSGKLNVLKPWLSYYTLFRRNERLALNVYAQNVGLAFGVPLERLDKTQDWTDPFTIAGVLRKPGFFAKILKKIRG